MAALFRLIDSKRPTLLFDEVDGIFNKKGPDGAEDIRKGPELGVRRRQEGLALGHPENELQASTVYCPKALAGLNHLPNSLGRTGRSRSR